MDLHLLGFGPGGYGTSLLSGLLLTIELAVSSYAASLVLGIGLAFLAVSNRYARILCWRPYASAITGIPSLLVLFLIYYDLPPLIGEVTGVNLDLGPLASGIIALTVVYAAYTGEAIRGAILNLPRGQFDAAGALGLRTLTTWRFVVLPQVWRLAFPGLLNTWLVLLKDTALVSLVGLNDLVRVSSVASGNTGESFLFFGAAGAAYVLCTVCSVLFARRVEARVNRGWIQGRRGVGRPA